MSFANLSWPVALLGLAGLVAALYALQRLRVRHRPVEVETTLFWRQAIEASRARVLVQRFRHPWAFVLVVAIAASLWLALAGLSRTGATERDHLVLIDGSAAMASGSRFDEARERALERAAALPRSVRTVVLCSDRAHTLLRPGEELALLRRRLAACRPQAAPNTVANVLQDFGRARGQRPLSVTVVGDVWWTEQQRAAFGDGVELAQVPIAASTAPNRGIVGLGVRPARAARWDQVDVLVDVTGGARGVQVAVDGTAVAPLGAAEAVGAHIHRLRFRVDAHGRELIVRLAGQDALALDDRAAFVLPDLRPLPVAIAPAVPAALRRCVRADPGLVEQSDGARVAIRMAGSDFAPDLPALELSDPERSADAFLVFHPENRDPDDVIAELYTRLGLDEIDAMAVAETAGRTITMGARPAERKAVWLWRELLDERYDFVHSRSFPLFVGLSLRWLIGVERGPERIAAGEAIALGDTEVRCAERRERAFSERFVPRTAGAYAPANGAVFAASLLDPIASGVSPEDAVALPVASTAFAGFDLVTWLLLLALLLLLVEWVLFRTGRMP